MALAGFSVLNYRGNMLTGWGGERVKGETLRRAGKEGPGHVWAGKGPNWVGKDDPGGHIVGDCT